MWINRRVFLFCVLAVASVSHAAQDDTKPPTWQVEGFLAALKDENPQVLVAAIQNTEARDKLLVALGERAKNIAPRLAELLRDSNPSVRQAAVEALGRLGVKEQAPKLVELLRDSDSSVRQAAAEALGKLGAKEQAPKLVELLRGSDSSVRQAAAEALGKLGAKEQAPALAKLLRDSDQFVRQTAAEALGAMGAKEQILELVELLRDSDWFTRRAAAQALGALGAMGAKEQAPELAKLLRDSDSSVRQAAVEAMGAMGAAAQLAKLLRDPDEAVRELAVKALGAMGAKEQIPELVELLRDPDNNVRQAAAWALGKLGAKEQAPALAKLLRDSDWRVRQAAAEALGKLGAKEQAPALAKLLRDSDQFVRQTAAEALGAMGAKEQILELVELLRDDEEDVRQAAVEALGKLGAKEQAPELVELLRDSNRSVRWRVAKALGKLGAVAQLAKLLRDDEDDVREFAVSVLGELGAVAQEQILELAKLLRDPDRLVRWAVAEALGELGAKEQAPALAELLHDSDSSVRGAAAWALARLGVKEQAPALAKLLRDDEGYVHQTAVKALSTMGPHDLKTLSSILFIVYDDSSRTGEIRFWGHFLGGGNPDIETLTSWIGEPITRPITAIGQNHDLAVKTLHVFEQAWPSSEPFSKLRRDLEIQIATVVQTGRWNTDDLPLLKTHATNLEAIGSTHAAAVRQVIVSLETSDHALAIAKVALGHVLFWLALIAVYPRSRIVQAIFFWNPWVRRFTGLGYVSFALTWVPFLRTKLFAPFKPSLVADAALDAFDEATYFPDSVVKEKISGRQQPLREAIPAIRGQIVLEGESGIGKTMFLRLLVERAQRVVVYLPARKCVGGVLEAIQAKLHGPAQDPAFLRNLIYSGALDICIDGLNEVSADARAKITGFVESYFKGNILMSTQPLEWTPPATAKSYVLEPLTESQIETFLLSRKASLPDDAQLVGNAYEQTCRHYLTATLDPQQSPETLAAMRQLLSNPMDLTLVATMLARGETPDLFRLQQQQYRIMAEDYRGKHLHEFPLHQFAEAVYQMRLKDEDTLPIGEFVEELQCMERHKMAVSRSLDEGGKSRTEWHFRHDKIADFFVVQAFLGPDNDKPEKHLGDTRFRGVYLQLARLLPLDDARVLERRLIDYAADTQDHTVSDTFIQLLRSRREENEGTPN